MPPCSTKNLKFKILHDVKEKTNIIFKMTTEMGNVSVVTTWPLMVTWCFTHNFCSICKMVLEKSKNVKFSLTVQKQNLPCGILGQVWYLIVSHPDLCRLSYFNLFGVFDYRAHWMPADCFSRLYEARTFGKKQLSIRFYTRLLAENP